MTEIQIKTGGLMRCCTATLDDMMDERGLEVDNYTEGETLDCKYEEPGNKNMVFHAGTWQWSGYLGM